MIPEKYSAHLTNDRTHCIDCKHSSREAGINWCNLIDSHIQDVDDPALCYEVEE